MPFPQALVRRLFAESDATNDPQQKGRILEDIACVLFEAVPGIELRQRNVLNAFAAEEIDVAFWNGKHKNGFPFLPFVILLECKNWSRPVGDQEVAVYIDRLRNRALQFGILIALNGVTGDAQQLTAANFAIATALREGISLIVLTRQDLESLTSLRNFKRLLKAKILQLTVSGSSFPQ